MTASNSITVPNNPKEIIQITKNKRGDIRIYPTERRINKLVSYWQSEVRQNVLLNNTDAVDEALDYYNQSVVVRERILEQKRKLKIVDDAEQEMAAVIQAKIQDFKARNLPVEVGYGSTFSGTIQVTFKLDTGKINDNSN